MDYCDINENESILRNLWNEVWFTVDGKPIIEFLSKKEPNNGFYNKKQNIYVKINREKFYPRWLHGFIQIEVHVENYNMYIPLCELIDDNPELNNKLQDKVYSYIIHKYPKQIVGVDNRQTELIAEYLRMEFFTRVKCYIPDHFNILNEYFNSDIRHIIIDKTEPWLFNYYHGK